MEAQLAHLGFIQAIISRMAGNSFLLKGWSVTLVAAIFALSAKETNTGFILLAYFPCIVFWALDAFFLHQEKMYRKLYEGVATGVIKSDQMTLDASAQSAHVPSLLRLAFSRTLAPFHGVIFSLIIFVMCVLLPAPRCVS